MTVYILMALFSCVYAYRRLTRPGMSAEVRLVFIRKHIAYVGTFICVWCFYLAYSYFKLFYAGININDGHHGNLVTLETTLQTVSIVTAMLTGTIMSVIRI